MFLKYLISVSKIFNDTMSETICGSPLYMAPEILTYKPYNSKADLWSVGIILFEMYLVKHHIIVNPFIN